MNASPALFLVCLLGLAPAPAATPSDPVAQLAKVKSFAFGGVGYAGTLSAGERCFREILEGGDALARFRMVLEKGSPEARLYALCGIRALDPASLSSAAAPLRQKDPQVETLSGCMVAHERASTVIARIARGTYDRHWSKK